MSSAPRSTGLIVLGALTALGSLGIHMFVPALPAAAAELGANSSDMQQAISAYVFGLAIGHIIWGPVSDRIARQRILLWAIAAFFVGSITCAAAQGIEILLAGRVVQAVGGSGALIICRALVVDESPRGRVAGRLGILSAVTLASPALAPLLGGLAAAIFGWRSIFLLLALLACAAWVYVGRGKQWSTAARPAHPVLEGPLRSYVILLKNRGFIGFAAANALMVSSFYVFLSASPFIFMVEHRLSSVSAGFCYFAIAGAMISGTLMVGLLERSGRPGHLWAGLVTLIVGASSLLAAAALAPQSLAALILPMMALGLGSGLLGPLMIATSMQAEPKISGAASTLFGAVQMAMTAIISASTAIAVRGISGTLTAVAGTALAACVSLLLLEFLCAGKPAFKGTDGTRSDATPH